MKILNPNKIKNVTKKLFFREHDEDVCVQLKWHIKYMKENCIKEMKVFLAEREIDSDYFYCTKFSEVGEKNQGFCGIRCKEYNPKNKKSGACKHLGGMYEQKDDYLVIQIDATEFINN